MKYKITIDGKAYAVQVKSIVGDLAQVEVNGKAYSVAVKGERPAATGIAPARKAGGAPAVQPAAQAPQVPADGGKAVTAPLPGVIIHLLVAAGQTVQRGDKIAVLEAMKMENDILAPVDGKVLSLSVRQGDPVLEGAIIATIG